MVRVNTLGPSVPDAERRIGRQLSTRRCWLLGAIAQLVERVLCKHEVVGSIPSGSTTSRTKALSSDRSNEIPVAWLTAGVRVDIVNEGFARACSSPFRVDLRRHQFWQIRSPGAVLTSGT